MEQGPGGKAPCKGMKNKAPGRLNLEILKLNLLFL